MAATRRPTVSRPTLGKTEFIAQDNGHLLPTIKKRDSALSGAFATGYENMPSTRWPEKTVKSGDPFAGTSPERPPWATRESRRPTCGTLSATLWSRRATD